MTVIIRARVVNGQGEGKKFVSLDWVRAQILKKFGFAPYRGTLNLVMDHSAAATFQAYTEKQQGIPLGSNQGECEGVCYRVRINGITGVVVIPQVPEYPRWQLEIIAPVNLRNALTLEDGCEIVVSFID